MEKRRKYSAASMAILEILIQETSAKTSKYIVEKLPHEMQKKAVFLFSPMIREGVLSTKDIGEPKQGYSITRKGRDFVAQKSKFELVEFLSAPSKNSKIDPDTGETISAYAFNKKQAEPWLRVAKARSKTKGQA